MRYEPACWSVCFRAAMQLSPIKASWGGRVDCDSRVNRLRAFKKTLPERILRQGLGLTPLDETINNLHFCFLRHENSLAGILASVVFSSVTAIQTCIWGHKRFISWFTTHTAQKRAWGQVENNNPPRTFLQHTGPPQLSINVQCKLCNVSLPGIHHSPQSWAF